MYTRFVAYFLGAFLISIVVAALFVSFTQLEKVKATVSTAIGDRANNIKALVNEQSLSVVDACNYIATGDIDISVYSLIDDIGVSLSKEELNKIKTGETVIFYNSNSNTKFLATLKLRGKYIVITPNMISNPINQFMTLQKTITFVPVIIGSILIIFAVAMVLRPIREISDASKEVAIGNFNASVKVRGNDEIAVLSRNFNLMVKELSANEYLHKDFVSNVSHEFKTPITSLKGYAKLLKKDDLTKEQRQEYADIIISESERLSNLSSNLLKLSKLENEVIKHRKDKFSLAEQIRDVILLLQDGWENKNLELDLDLNEVEFTGDKELLYEVWINLISNSIKYSNDNGTLRITVKKRDKIIVEIIDDGIGMTIEEQDKIFLRFYKADKSRNTSGTGLGLSIAKKIVELHLGTISVESEVGKGSKFVVII
jgi:signal transduction histidine kinase